MRPPVTGETGPAMPAVGLFASPLAGWANDDLLLTEDARTLAAAAYPAAFPVLDWPELRALFSRHDALALAAKRRINQHGRLGLSLVAVGTTLLAGLPVLRAGAVQHATAMLGCAGVVVGTLLCLWNIWGHTAKSEWLLNRIWSERLRQFHFQYIINSMTAAARAMGDDGEMAAYAAGRNGALGAFVYNLKGDLAMWGPRRAVAWVADDHDDARLWAIREWRDDASLAALAPSPAVTQLVQALADRRIAIQTRYAESNLNMSQASQRLKSVLHNRLVDLASIWFAAALLSAGILLIYDGARYRPIIDDLIALSGGIAAWGLYFRLVDQGMGYTTDTERYEVYALQTELVQQKFTHAHGNVAQQIEPLRALEKYAYREMRQFLKSHLAANFW